MLTFTQGHKCGGFDGRVIAATVLIDRVIEVPTLALSVPDGLPVAKSSLS